MRRVSRIVIAVLCLTACAAHEKNGDRAAEGRMEGLFSEVMPVNDESNLASEFSRPSTHAKAFRLTRVQARVAAGDYQNELGLDGPPDPVVEIEQGGRVVYRSKKAQDQYEVDWSPNTVNLFVEPGEQLVVRVWDIDASSDDLVMASTFPAHLLTRGGFQFQTQAGSHVNLRFEPRQTEAPRAVARVQ